MKSNSEIYLGLDIGTTSVKAGLVSAEGLGLAQRSCEYPTYFPETGYAEQSADDWWHAACKAVRELSEAFPKETKQIKSISISSQAPTMLPIDAKGNPLRNALIWMDQRAKEECAFLREYHADYIRRNMCNRIDPYYALPKLLWFKKNEPDWYRDTFTILQANGWLIYKLTGKFSVDESSAALTQVLNVHTMTIDAAFLDVRLSNVASTVTSAIVFLPLLFIGGIIGELFLDLAISVASGLLFSLFYSFSALPALCVLFLREDAKKCKCRAFPLLEERLAKVLRKTNKIRFLCPALALAFTILSLLAMLGLKKEMQEKTREKFFCEKIVFPCGADLKLVESKAKALSCRIKEAQGVKNVFSQGGVERTDLNFLANAENKKESVFLFIEADDMKKCKKFMKTQKKIS